MPEDLRAAHERNDEVLERIYVGRRFKNDTERLEKLFDFYTKMIAAAAPAKGRKRKAEPTHDRNDEVPERIYITRRFDSDTTRLEKLSVLCAERTVKVSASK